MPVFVEDPTQCSKERLKSELLSHNVDLPPAESKKQVYVELYRKHVGSKHSADFSSDEEDQVQNDKEERETGESDMLDLSLLTDDQLKKLLHQYGIAAGPIVGTTRSLYERKLKRTMAYSSQSSVNGTTDAGHYSDSEEEEAYEAEEEESGSEQLDPETVSHTEPSETTSTVKSKQRSIESSQSSSQSFSITQLIENRLSPQSKLAETKKRCSQTPVPSRMQWSHQELSKNTKTNTSLYLTPDLSLHQKQTTTIKPATEPMTDILTELFPDAAITPTGIIATKRRPIKGAAGRPVQFKFTEIPLDPATVERQEILQSLVPLWVQIVVFVFVLCLLYLIYVFTEDAPENPFSALLEGLTQEETIDNELSFIPRPADKSTSEVAA